MAIVPAGDLVRKAANFFDLEGKTVTFTPAGENGYTVTVGGLEWSAAVASGARTQLHYYKHYVTVDLPFPFPFAGRTWTRVYANGTGNLSFYRPEDENWPNRSPWSAGTVRHVAAAVDSRAVAGFESMIAALWAIYEDVTVSVDSSSAGVTVTWRGGRRDHGHVPLGENEFQARLRPSGAVELAFRKVAERDGIVGLFHGADARGASLDVLTDQAGDVSHPMLDIVRAELVDNGSTILARIELAAGRAAGRSTEFDFLRGQAGVCRLGLRVGHQGGPDRSAADHGMVVRGTKRCGRMGAWQRDRDRRLQDGVPRLPGDVVARIRHLVGRGPRWHRSADRPSLKPRPRPQRTRLRAGCRQRV